MMLFQVKLLRTTEDENNLTEKVLFKKINFDSIASEF